MMLKTDSKTNLGKKRVTLKDIAKRLDVSHATVSRALNDASDPFISEGTRRKVREMAAELGYRPNNAARVLATGRTGLLALWLWSEHVQGSYHAVVSQRMHAEAMRRSYQLIVDLVGYQTLEMPAFDAWNVDGIIAHESAPAILAQLKGGSRPPTPIVATGAFHLLEGVDQVSVDIIQGARDAMRHLVAQNRRRIMYLTDDLPQRKADARYVAYTEAMEAAGLELEFLEANGPRSAVRAIVRDYVAAKGCPEAILCHNDDIALAAYRGLCDLKIRVPDQVALIGCDGIEETEYLEVPLTTIAQPFDEVFAIACQFLEQRIEDPSRPLQRASLKAELIVRESSQTS